MSKYPFSSATLSAGASVLVLLAMAVGCATSQGNKAPAPVTVTDALPRIGGNIEVMQDLGANELNQLRLIATNLTATLVQIPEMQPAIVTLQTSSPQSAFGNVIIRALEDAGFGIQRVSADQGKNYVSYSKRISETDSGLVTDYELAVGPVRLRREYIVEADAVYPSSLMQITGTSFLADIDLADEIFTEQGGQNTAFISGTQRLGIPDPDLEVSTIAVNDFDELPLDKRTRQDRVFSEARQRYFETDAQRTAPNLDNYSKYRRTVLIFDDNNTQMMGAVNKQAVRMLVREFNKYDLFVIRACQDADGRDPASLRRAIRVEEEMAGFGVPAASAYIAPCVRTSYRHASDNSPTPVEIIHYRPKLP